MRKKLRAGIGIPASTLLLAVVAGTAGAQQAPPSQQAQAGAGHRGDRGDVPQTLGGRVSGPPPRSMS
ncbi:MAG: hypothetical protein WDN69_21620 [Aliidongia sp.]